MKLEDLIKQKVAQHQEAYDPKAWEALSSKMGVAKTTSLLKWWVAASVIAVVGITSFFLWKTEKPSETTLVVQENKTKEDKAATSLDTAISEVKTVKTEDEKETKLTDDKNQTIIPVPDKYTIKTTVEDMVKNEIVEPIIEKVKPTQEELKKTSPTTTPTYDLRNWATTVCGNENIRLVNQNEQSILLVKDANVKEIAKGGVLETKSLKPGIYQIQSKDNKTIQQLEVVDVSAPTFVEDLIYYEKGIPLIPVRVSANYAKYDWKVNGKTIGEEKEVFVPAFEKGMVNITFIGSNKQCEVKGSYAINVRNDYNLLAVNAFNIESNDVRNRSFLPFALYDRGTPFEMQITDPSTGEVIFKTNATDNPWKGIDNRTGELVTPNTRYIWTVSLSEKTKHEPKAVYQGVIMRVEY